jgi:hypothetical protein
MQRIIYYYQTFIPLSLILFTNPFVTHIHLSSIHFGVNNDSSPYIHLNDFPPNNTKFDEVWKHLEISRQNNIKNILMIGGAGGAYKYLFSDFNTYYKLLFDVIVKYPIDGIDLDIEEPVKLNDVKMLIRKIRLDFGKDFIISMAPVSFALKSNISGLGNFSYKELYNSDEGKFIDYFNGQFYGDYNFNSYQKVINNNYPPNKIVMGMLSEDVFNNFCYTYNVVKNLSNTYKNFGGVFIWEYYNAPPIVDFPILWSYYMYSALNNYSNCLN